VLRAPAQRERWINRSRYHRAFVTIVQQNMQANDEVLGLEVEWYDQLASINRNFLVKYFVESHSVEMIDIKNRRCVPRWSAGAAAIALLTCNCCDIAGSSLRRSARLRT
jgi:hypothetical protein